jgi:hypothetical protein
LLLPKVLEGLAKFAHLINVDFFGDLLNVLKKISATQHEDYIAGKQTNLSTTVCSLHCIIAAFELLETLGDSLRIDLRDFYVSMYTQMTRLCASPGSAEKLTARYASRNEVEILLSGIESMLKKNREVDEINPDTDRESRVIHQTTRDLIYSVASQCCNRVHGDNQERAETVPDPDAVH